MTEPSDALECIKYLRAENERLGKKAHDLAGDKIDLRSRLSAAEARARESALDALAAYGQASDAHNAQLAAEAKLAELEAAQSEALCATYFGMLVSKAHVAARKASRKYPQPNYVTLKIAEEAGEVVRGAVHYAEGRMEWSEVEGEIVQLLAMVIRFVNEGDQVNGIIPPADLADRVKGGGE